jgi:hypothetical protein
MVGREVIQKLKPYITVICNCPEKSTIYREIVALKVRVFSELIVTEHGRVLKC